MSTTNISLRQNSRKKGDDTSQHNQTLNISFICYLSKLIGFRIDRTPFFYNLKLI